MAFHNYRFAGSEGLLNWQRVCRLVAMWLRLFAAAATGVTAVVLPGAAGELSRTDSLGIFFDTQFVDTQYQCTHRFSGPIEIGDAQKIIDAEPSLLCLDSPGGVLTEALKVTKWMIENPVATKLEKGASCHSACAIMFMGGSFRPHESDGPMSWRVMHPTSSLGFHAPALLVPQGQYSDATVNKAYQLALQSISKIVEDLIQRKPEAGSGLKFSLLAEMLNTPASEMLTVDTVDQAGRWSIDVGPFKAEKLATRKLFHTACANAYSWKRDESARSLYRSLVSDIDFNSAFQTSWLLNKDTDQEFSGDVIINEMSGSGCRLSHNKTATAFANRVMVDQEFMAFSPLMGIAPLTRLVDLPEPEIPIQKLGTTFGVCTVTKQQREIDNENCVREKFREDGDLVSLFRWPSGSRTIIKVSAGLATLNDNETKIEQAEGKQVCARNPKSGNRFCFKPRG